LGFFCFVDACAETVARTTPKMARTIRAGEDEVFIKGFFIKLHGRKTALFQTGMLWSVVSNRNSLPVFGTADAANSPKLSAQ